MRWELSVALSFLNLFSRNVSKGDVPPYRRNMVSQIQLALIDEKIVMNHSDFEKKFELSTYFIVNSGKVLVEAQEEKHWTAFE